MKGDNLNQPNPEVSTYTDPNSQWIIPMLLSSPNPSRLTKNIIKKVLNQRGIQYNDKQVKSELVTILRANIQSETQNRIEEARQAANTSNFIEGKTLSLDKENQLEIRSEYFRIVWALKEMQEYGKRGGRKHMTVRIIELLKSFFHAGDVDKSE